MYACGLRVGEAATPEVTAIDRARGVLRVIGKGDKERLVRCPNLFSTISAGSGSPIATAAGCSPTTAATRH
jgi:integrase